jgi:hypothetical protein
MMKKLSILLLLASGIANAQFLEQIDNPEKEIAEHHLSPEEAKIWIETRNFMIQYFQIPPDTEIENFDCGRRFYPYTDNSATISWTTKAPNGHLIGHARAYDFNKEQPVVNNLLPCDVDLTASGLDNH